MLNPKVDNPPFAASVAAAVPLQHYQVDTAHQPLGSKHQNDSRFTQITSILQVFNCESNEEWIHIVTQIKLICENVSVSLPHYWYYW